MSANPTAVEVAAEFIIRAIDHGTWSESGRLPTTIELARAAGVCTATMSRAIALARQKGYITVRKKKGIELAKPICDGAAAPTGHPRIAFRSDDIAHRLVNDIYQGQFPRHELPSYKELRKQYGGGYRTLRTALRQLLSQGILELHTRKFRIATSSQAIRTLSLALIVGEEWDEHVRSWSYARSYFYTLLYALEGECARRNIHLEVYRHPTDFRALKRIKNICGYFVVLEESPQKATIALIERLTDLPVPVVIHRGEAVAAYDALPPRRNLFFLESSDEKAGLEVGKFLLARDHRRIAYLTDRSQTYWSKGRLKGLQAVAQLAGGTAEVIVREVDNAGKVGIDREIDELLRDPSISAWVASEDNLAINHLLPGLAKRKKQPGIDISVVGFDDQLEAFESHLTSYNFNSVGVAQAAVSLALYSRYPKDFIMQQHTTLWVDGYVVERNTTRKKNSE